MKISILTLGCKLNKYESDCMANILSNAGNEVVSNLEYADLYIINTCAVTAESEKKSRQYISKVRKLNKDAKVIICGCASQNNASQFERDGVTTIIGNEGKENILNYINTNVKNVTEFSGVYGNLHSPLITTTRAYLKVQDGCNNFCTYCLIPYLRGRSRSRDINECVAEANELSKTCKEIVITGVDISDYKPSLALLMSQLGHVHARVRLGSLEVNVVTDEFMQTLLAMPNFCPQFHLSLQSGDNTTLKRMNRHYTREEYLEKVNLIYKYFPNANITTDVIVGFAGETEEQFLNTVDLCKKAKFGKIHVFPFSKREGTVAYKFVDCTPEQKKDRVSRLSKEGYELEQQFFENNIGKYFVVLTEDIEGEYVVGYTENYIKCYLPKDTKQNELFGVELVKSLNDGMIAKII